MKRTIKVTICNEYTKGDHVDIGAAGSHDDVVLELRFNAMWDGLAKSITWLDAEGQNPTLQVLTTDLLNEAGDAYLVPIPAPPKAIEGDCFMTIKGAEVEADLETRATLTATATFQVLESKYSDDAAEAGDVPATVAEQIQAQVEAIKADIVLAGKAADAKEAAEASAAAAKESQEAAAASEAAAKAAQDAAVTSETIACQAAGAAAKAEANAKASEEAAKASETAALTSAESAAKDATTAAAAVTTAVDAAQDTAGSKASAEQSAKDAAASASAAASSASAAAGHDTAAAESAKTARESAQGAASSEDRADTAASSAVTSANTATSQASAAAAYAATATTKASEAESSAGKAAGSAASAQTYAAQAKEAKEGVTSSKDAAAASAKAAAQSEAKAKEYAEQAGQAAGGDFATKTELANGLAGKDDAGLAASALVTAKAYTDTEKAKYLPLTGGTLTGNLTGQYLTGTWLRGTAGNHMTGKAAKVAVQDGDGWVYYRTPAELLGDMGGATSADVDAYLDKALTESKAYTDSVAETKISQNEDILIQVEDGAVQAHLGPDVLDLKTPEAHTQVVADGITTQRVSGLADPEEDNCAASKGYVDAQVSTLKTSVSEGKALVAAAVTGKGVQTAADATFATMADNIKSIPASAAPKLQARTVSPSKSRQTIKPGTGYDGLSQVVINAVTSSIDSNIMAYNIKSGVSILGVRGTFTGSGGSGSGGKMVEMPGPLEGYSISPADTIGSNWNLIVGMLYGEPTNPGGIIAFAFYPNDSSKTIALLSSMESMTGPEILSWNGYEIEGVGAPFCGDMMLWVFYNVEDAG